MPKDSISWVEFRKRMKGFADEEYFTINERLKTNFSREKYDFLTEGEAKLLGAVLDRLLPQNGADEKIDLVGFLDWALPLPLGYGHRNEDMPDEQTVFHEGLKGIDQTANAMFSNRDFLQLPDGDKDRVLRAIQEGNAEGQVWARIPSSEFLKQLMQKAVAGYCAHPKTWMRIGFYGPAYPEGYVWVSNDEVKARHEKKPGHLTF